MADTGTKCQHISNNAPTNLAGPDEEKRKAGVAIAKKWLDGCAMLGAKSMRMNSRRRSARRSARTPFRVRQATATRATSTSSRCCSGIESYKEMADYGGNLGIKVTHREPLGPGRGSAEHPHHPGRGEPPLLRGVTGLLQLGARVHAVPRPEGAGALRPHQRAREVLGSLGRQERRAAVASRSCSRAGSRAPSRWSTRKGR